MATEKITSISEKNVKNTYTKEQILESEKYINRRDLINAILDDNKEYTTTEADIMIEKFLKGKVTG